MVEQSMRYTAGKDPFGKKREESCDEGSPRISSHETMVAFPNKKLKNLSLKSIVE